MVAVTHTPAWRPGRRNGLEHRRSARAAMAAVTHTPPSRGRGPFCATAAAAHGDSRNSRCRKGPTPAASTRPRAWKPCRAPCAAAGAVLAGGHSSLKRQRSLLEAGRTYCVSGRRPQRKGTACPGLRGARAPRRSRRHTHLSRDLSDSYSAAARPSLPQASASHLRGSTRAWPESASH